MKKGIVFLLLCLYGFTFVFGVELNLPKLEELETYYGWWKDGAGSEAPGYVYDFLLPEAVDIGDGKSREGAIIKMIATGEDSDFPSAAEVCISTDEAMGYGMLLAVMNGDKDLFHKLLRVVEYYKTDNSKYSNLTSWLIPAKHATTLDENGNIILDTWDRSPEYKQFEIDDTEALNNGESWVSLTPSELRDHDDYGWKVLSKAKYDPVKKQYIGQHRRIPDGEINAGQLTVSNIAMDGELDIAMALYMAHHKWVYDGTHDWMKNDKYKYIDKSFKRFKDIAAIVDSYGIHKSTNGEIDYFLPTGDHFYNGANDITRPCDWMLSHFRAFYEGQGQQQTKRLIGAIQEQMEHFSSTDKDGINDTGLVPDFAEFNKVNFEKQKLAPVYTTKTNSKGEIVSVAGEDFADNWYTNAGRYPARMAMDYIMYKDKYSLEKAVDILKFSKAEADKVSDEDKKANTFFAPNRKIDGTVVDDSFESQVLKAAMLMTIFALDQSGDQTYNEVFNKYIERKSWGKTFPENFGSYYGDFWCELEIYTGKIVNGAKEKRTYYADLRKDPAHNFYFEDTWTLMALNTMNGDWIRPHVWPNEFELSDTKWAITAGSGYAQLVEIDNGLQINILKAPENTDNEGNEFDITLEASGFDAKPKSGFHFDFNIDRSTIGSSNILAELSYPGLKDSDGNSIGVPMMIREPITLERDYPMHKMGQFNGQTSISVQSTAKLKIGLNSGLKDGTVIKLYDIGLYDPPGEVERYRYVGQWRSDRKYKKHDYVRYHHETYECIKDIDGGVANNPEARGDSWKICDYNLIGTKWTSNTYYYDGDLVYFEGRTYIAKTSFTSINPPPTAESVWMLYYDSIGKMDVTEWYEDAYFRKGDYVTFKGNAYIAKTPHKSIIGWDPATAFTLWEKCNSIFIDVKPPVWETWTEYITGSYVVFNDTKYKCVIGHTSQPGWDPETIPALWTVE